MRDLKYLFAYTVPLAAYVSFQSTGIWTYSLVFYAFLIIPLLDIITGESSENLAEEDVSYKKTKWVFDLMLYLNVPLVFGLLFLAFFNVATRTTARQNMLGWRYLAGSSWPRTASMWRMNWGIEKHTSTGSSASVCTCLACTCISTSSIISVTTSMWQHRKMAPPPATIKRFMDFGLPPFLGNTSARGSCNFNCSKGRTNLSFPSKTTCFGTTSSSLHTSLQSASSFPGTLCCLQDS